MNLSHAAHAPPRPRLLLRELRLLDVLLLLLPVSMALHWYGASPTLVFCTSGLAMVPLAAWMGRATEQLAEQAGEGVGGLLNATFGNAAELIIAVSGLRQGLQGVIKASLTGSIIGNILLVLGGCMLAGGWKREKQTFNATAASAGASALTLAAIGLICPAAFTMLTHGQTGHDYDLSMAISIVLLLTYGCSLLFSLKTHRHLYLGKLLEADAPMELWGWPVALAVLGVATLGVASMSDLLVRSVEAATSALGLNDVFVGVVIISIIGNAAEHTTAITMAMKDRMDLSLGITLGSSTQIALFVAPVLVVISHFMQQRMDLAFTPAEVGAITLSVFIMGQMAQDGESNWWEGVQLLSVYVILAMVFFYI